MFLALLFLLEYRLESEVFWVSRNYSVDKRMGFLAKVAVVYQGNVSLGWNKWQQYTVYCIYVFVCVCMCDGHWMNCTMHACLFLRVCE